MEKTEIQNDIRDLINWTAVFGKEYDLPTEVVKKFEIKLRKISQKIDLL